jgi:GrpB-like predicted nucleotidyltransferase (UPF0157 family)
VKLMIEHVGSSAVAGLGGKGIIDLAIVNPEVEKAMVLLEKLGYEHKVGGDDPGIRWFMKRSDMTTGQVFHVHLMEDKMGEFERMVRFRDYLRAHPDMAKAYADEKRRAVKAVEGLQTKEEQREVYMATKAGIIRRIIRLSSKHA